MASSSVCTSNMSLYGKVCHSHFNKATQCHGILSLLVQLSQAHFLTINTRIHTPVPDTTGSDRCLGYTRKLQQDMFTVTHMVVSL